MSRVNWKARSTRGAAPFTDMSSRELADEISYWRSQVETTTPFAKLLRTHGCKLELGKRFQADLAEQPAAVILTRWGKILDPIYIQKQLEKQQKELENDSD